MTHCALWLTVMSVIASWAGGLHAEMVPPRGLIDQRVRAVAYHPEQVYRLTGYPGYAIGIVLEEGETYRGIGTGDSEAITVDVQGQYVFIKPSAVPFETNLTLLTDRRRYYFDYHVADRAPQDSDDDVIYSLRFLYPAPPKPATVAVPALPPRRRNADYWYCGHPALRPEAASDDGVQTRIRFSSRGEVPALYVRNEDESESLLNYSIDETTGDVVVHRVAARFLLRRGGLVGCIVNRQYGGSGERLPTGTILPNVRRETRGGTP